MKENTEIRIRSAERTAEAGFPAGNRSEFFYRGIRREMSGKTHVLYEEHAGEGGPDTKTHLVVADSSFEVRKSGGTDMSFVFREGVKTEASYRNSYGAIPFEVLTDALRVERRAGSVAVSLSYRLFSGGQEVSDREMEVEIK